MPHDTLAAALEALDALIAEPARLPGGDLQTLAREVAYDVTALARARGIEVVMEVRGGAWLTGRDLRRWRYLLRQSLASIADELPTGSGLRSRLAASRPPAVIAGCRPTWRQSSPATAKHPWGLARRRVSASSRSSSRRRCDCLTGRVPASRPLRVACFDWSRRWRREDAKKTMRTLVQLMTHPFAEGSTARPIAPHTFLGLAATPRRRAGALPDRASER